MGLGGKDDLTNVFSKKEAAVITPISLEHTAILGNTREAIAENKAGIITPDCLTICAQQSDPTIEEIIKNICLQKQSTFISVSQQNPTIPTSSIKMRGQHQIDNAKTAYTLAQQLKRKGYNINDESIINGLNSAFLPGRFEIIETNFFNQINNNISASVVLDGAHNGDSALALAQTLEDVFPDKEVIFIIGVNQDKNLEDIFTALKSKIKKIIATCSDNYRALSPEEIRTRILACNSNASIMCSRNINDALSEANKEKHFHDIICVCGSFYLVAEARQMLLNNLSHK